MRKRYIQFLLRLLNRAVNVDASELLVVMIPVPHILLKSPSTLDERVKLADQVGNLADAAARQAINNRIKVDWTSERTLARLRNRVRGSLA